MTPGPGLVRTAEVSVTVASIVDDCVLETSVEVSKLVAVVN